jgi:hypothetical protein
MFFNKALDDLTYDDVLWLLENKFSESMNLEYKGDEIKNDDVTAAISSLANSEGGRIVFGVTSDKQRNAPKEICGINLENNLLDRISNISSNISPPIVPQIQVVDIPKGVNSKYRQLVVIEIESSNKRPHMNTDNKYYIRLETGKKPAPHIIVRDMFFSSYSDAGIDQSVSTNIPFYLHFQANDIEISFKVAPYYLRHNFIHISSSNRKILEEITKKYYPQSLGEMRISPEYFSIFHFENQNGLAISNKGVINFICNNSQWEYPEIIFIQNLETTLDKLFTFSSELFAKFNYYNFVQCSLLINNISHAFLLRKPSPISLDLYKKGFLKRAKSQSNKIEIQEYFAPKDFFVEDRSSIIRTILDQICPHFGFADLEGLSQSRGNN